MSASYDLYSLHTQSEEQDSKYFGISMFVHTLLAIGSLYVTVPLLEKMNKTEITIEIVEPEKPKPIMKTLAAPRGEVVKATRGAKAMRSPMPSAPLESEIAEVVKGPVLKSTKTQSAIAKLKTHVSGGKAQFAKAAPSRVGIPETIEDIAAPDLDMDGVVAAQVGNLGDDELEPEFKNVDRSNAAALRAQKSELDEEAKLIADEQDQALKSIEEQNLKNARAMEDALKATRTRNAAALAQIKAAEQAAAERAAKEAALAKAARERASGSGTANAGRGSGAIGEDRKGTGVAGDPNAVRTLDQLRQMPGNPKPNYSIDERLRKEQGAVSFHAYISRAGQPTQFRKMKSTGFTNLDEKTLAALKRWKFYPGQEGWVEIPFQWDLKGGVQELPTLLRRVGSR